MNLLQKCKIPPLRHVWSIKRLLGRILLDSEFITYQDLQIKYGLRHQKKIVTACLIAALSLLNLFIGQETHAFSQNSSAKVTISATVKERATMQVLNQVQDLVVTDADIERGYVEVSAGSRINVKTNNRAGCLLAFELLSGTSTLFHAVSVRIKGREVQFSSSGWIQQPYVLGGSIEEVTYHFMLSQDAQLGRYNWPLAISVLPLGGH